MIKTTIMVGAASVASAASLASLAVLSRDRAQSQKSINVSVCRSVVSLDRTIRTSLGESLKTLPTITYYKHHPAELLQQQRLIARELEQFTPPRACTSVIH